MAVAVQGCPAPVWSPPLMPHAPMSMMATERAMAIKTQRMVRLIARRLSGVSIFRRATVRAMSRAARRSMFLTLMKILLLADGQSGTLTNLLVSHSHVKTLKREWLRMAHVVPTLE